MVQIGEIEIPETVTTTTGNGTSVVINAQDYTYRYELIKDSDWFNTTYKDISLGQIIKTE